MRLFTDTFLTSFGPFSMAVDDEGRLLATAFGALDTLRERLSLVSKRHGASDKQIRDSAALQAMREQVLAYDAGERTIFDVPLAPRGTAFQQRVWDALCRIPFGATRTYGQLARELGQPSASRAVGRANATNPICLIVPCHRVIGANGALTGFAFGEDIKRRLLEHEQHFAPAPQDRALAASG